MQHIVFGPISQWWRIIKKNIPGARSSPKSNQFVLVTHTPKLFTKFNLKPSPTLWDILLTDRQTDRDRCEKVIIWTVRPTIHIIELIKRLKRRVRSTLKQGVTGSRLRQVFFKNIKRHQIEFVKYNMNNKNIINETFVQIKYYKRGAIPLGTHLEEQWYWGGSLRGT